MLSSLTPHLRVARVTRGSIKARLSPLSLLPFSSTTTASSSFQAISSTRRPLRSLGTLRTTHQPSLQRLRIPQLAHYSTTRQLSQKQAAQSQTTAEEDMSEPTGLIAKSGIELLTFGTPNGYKASILLEELKEAYGKDYTWQSINIMKNTQKEPWFTAICPNGRIPAIVDHDRNGFAVFEGLSILTYLTRHYDPEHRFSFPVDSDDYSVAEQWMAWQHGGLGPMQGQANHFYQFTKEKIPYPTQRYVGESERLYGVLDKRLEGREYVAGPGKGKYSIADISLVGWVNIATFSGLDLKQFPNVSAWYDRITARPATQKGFAIPNESQLRNAAVAQKLKEDPEAQKKAEENAKFLEEAKKQYNYKYSSP